MMSMRALLCCEILVLVGCGEGQPRRCSDSPWMCGPGQGCNTATNQCFDLSPMKNMAPSPVLSTVAPPVGPSAGGIELTLSGQGFLPGAKVEIAGQSATAVEVLSPTSLKATLPARPLSRDWGQVRVTVRNLGGAIGTRDDLFGYYASHFQLDSGGLAPYVGRGGPAEGVAAADCNGDMKADFACAAMGSNEIGVFLGDGQGGFSKTIIPVCAQPSSLSVGDLNGDNKLDLAVACASGASSFLLGTSNGSFGDPVVYGTGVRFFVLDDLNGDHLADVVTGAVGDILLSKSSPRPALTRC